MLNRKQIVVLGIGIALVILSELFPPWLRDGADVQGEISWGYHHFLSKAGDFPDLTGTTYFRLNKNRMTLQHVMLFCGTAGAILLSKNGRGKWQFIVGWLFILLAGLCVRGWVNDVVTFGF